MDSFGAKDYLSWVPIETTQENTNQIISFRLGSNRSVASKWLDDSPPKQNNDTVFRPIHNNNKDLSAKVIVVRGLTRAWIHGQNLYKSYDCTKKVLLHPWHMHNHV